MGGVWPVLFIAAAVIKDDIDGSTFKCITRIWDTSIC